MTRARIRPDLDPCDVPYIKEGHFDGEQGCIDGMALFKVVEQDEDKDGLNEGDGTNMTIWCYTRGHLRVNSLDFDFIEEGEK